MKKITSGGTRPELFFLKPNSLKNKCQLNICNREISNMDKSDLCVLIFDWCFRVPGLWRPWRLGGHAWDWRARWEAPEQTHTADAVDSQVGVPLFSAALLQGHDTQSQPQAGSLAVLHVAGLEKAPSGWGGTVRVVWRHSHFRGATLRSGLLVWACNACISYQNVFMWRLYSRITACSFVAASVCGWKQRVADGALSRRKLACGHWWS